MSHEKLKHMGAEFVGGFAYLNRVHMGNSSPTGFVLTPAGEEAIKAHEAKLAAAAAKVPAAKKVVKKPKAEPVVEAAPEPEAPAAEDDDLGASIDELLDSAE